MFLNFIYDDNATNLKNRFQRLNLEV
jgi:hypothetical protein